MNRKPLLLVLNNAPVVLFAIVIAVFTGAGGGAFFSGTNFTNILVQSSATAEEGGHGE